MSSWSTAESGFHRALAQKLVNLRADHQTSQGTLAAELGIDQAVVSRVESGQRRLNVAEAFAWLEALGLGPEESARCLQDVWRLNGERPPGFWNEPRSDIE